VAKVPKGKKPAVGDIPNDSPATSARLRGTTAASVLVDGDGLVYRCGFAVEKTRYLVTDALGEKKACCDDAKEADKSVSSPEDIIWSRKDLEPVENALSLVKHVIEKLQAKYSDLPLRIWLTPGIGNFREAIATRAKYKGNRDFARRPVHYRAIQDYLTKQWGARTTAGQEADDQLGIAMSSSEGSVCVSFDKDLLQLPGKHYNWATDEECTISKRDGFIRFYSQCLTGDATDNIPGVDGIGPVKATKLLAGVNSSKAAWQVVLDTYSAKYGEQGPKFALETAQLVYVRRKPDEIWQPPA
jgi:DNA polymerase-1